MRIVTAGPERVDDLEPLWKALQCHHAQVAPDRAGLRPRDVEDSWRLRRTKYLAHLALDGSFAKIADDESGAVGYAMVRLTEGSVGYATGQRIGHVDTLSVLPGARGSGVGGALMDAVEQELARLGVGEFSLDVVSGNDAALRFYERRGMRPFATTMLGRIPPSDPV